MPLHNPLANNSGSAIIDFGSTPESTAQVDVTGQVGIQSNSRIKVWFAERSMSDNDQTEHLMAGVFSRLVSGQIIPDIGFTIFAANLAGLATGQFRVEYRW